MEIIKKILKFLAGLIALGISFISISIIQDKLKISVKINHVTKKIFEEIDNKNIKITKTKTYPGVLKNKEFYNLIINIPSEKTKIELNDYFVKSPEYIPYSPLISPNIPESRYYFRTDNK